MCTSQSTTAVLDGRGRVHCVNYGFADAETLRRQIEPLLDGAALEREPVSAP